MGACEITMTLDGAKTKPEVFDAISEQRDEDSSENGHQHGYSGDWQTVYNIQLCEDKHFPNREEAYKYCEQQCNKREGVGVKFTDANGDLRWFIYGLAAC